MRGTKINFGEGGPVFDFETPAVDFETTVQNALVNVGTDLGSDNIYTQRGTTLKKDGAQGKMINSAWAAQAASFAALDTLAFIQDTELQSNPFKLQAFTLRCQKVVGQRIDLAVQAKCVTGEIIGMLAET